jgi:hypothetical protein
MDRLVSITAFVRVAENGGFSATARSLNVSRVADNGQRSGPGAGNRAWRASAERHHAAREPDRGSGANTMSGARVRAPVA